MGLFSRLRGKKDDPAKSKPKGKGDASKTRTDEVRAELGQMGYDQAQQAVKPRWQQGTRYRDERVDPLHSKEGAASGNINQVDLLAYEGIQIGDTNRGFFKESKSGEDIGDAARGIGIDEKDPRLAERSVATSRTADMMGLSNVIAETRFATHAGKSGTVSEAAPGRAIVETSDLEVTDPAIKAQLEKDPETNFGNDKGMDPFGCPARYRKDPKDGKVYRKKGATEMRGHDLTNPRTQKELNDLQWVDAITGQVDRHGGNIFIDPATGAVKGIDNDAAFGSQQSSNPGDLSSAKLGASHFAGMPTLIDADTARKIEGLDEADFRKRLAPLLTEAEVEAAISRLKACKQRIQFLRLAGSVVGESPDQQYQQWGDKTYQEQTEESEASYLGRAVQNRSDAESSLQRSGPRPDLKVETPEQASQWKPKEMPVQVPPHLKPAVEQMPSLLSPAFDRHRGPKPPPRPKAPGPQIGAQRMVKPPAVEQAVSKPPDRPPPSPPQSKPPDRPPPSPPPKTKPDAKPGEGVPTLKPPSQAGTAQATTPKPPPGVQVSKQPDRPPALNPDQLKKRPLPIPPQKK
jgi:hypothetical protein